MRTPSNEGPLACAHQAPLFIRPCVLGRPWRGSAQLAELCQQFVMRKTQNDDKGMIHGVKKGRRGKWGLRHLRRRRGIQLSFPEQISTFDKTCTNGVMRLYFSHYPPSRVPTTLYLRWFLFLMFSLKESSVLPKQPHEKDNTGCRGGGAGWRGGELPLPSQWKSG